MNIVVVENEPPVLDAVIAILRPFADVHHLVGLRDAKEVLAAAQMAGIDLLITDIRMPGMDGLELIQRLCEERNDVAVIVLSGDSEFESVRRALRLGVADYLLKPVKTEILRQAVARVLSVQAVARARRAQEREAVLARRLMGHPGVDADHLLDGNWGIIVTVCENWESPTTWQATLVDKDFVRRILTDDQSHTCEIIELDGQRRVILIPPDHTQLSQLETLAQRIHQAIQATGVVVHTAYDCKRAVDEPGLVMRRLLNRLRAGMQLEDSTFVPLNGAPDKATDSISNESQQRLTRGLARSTESAALIEIHAALDQLHRHGARQPVIMQTLDDLFHILRQHVDLETADHLPVYENIATMVRACRTYGELAAWVAAQMRMIVDHPRNPATPRELVAKLITRIQTAYWEDITLQAFAAEHGISVAYLSRLFKDRAGTTFSDYQIQVRIAKAKELLARQDLRLIDVSALVGYSDPKYFGQLFRRVAGMSPRDYQRATGSEKISNGGTGQIFDKTRGVQNG
jgi:two-component system, response regulator YesN